MGAPSSCPAVYAGTPSHLNAGTLPPPNHYATLLHLHCAEYLILPRRSAISRYIHIRDCRAVQGGIL